MTISEAQRRQYDTEGYVVLDNVFSDVDLDRVIAEVDQFTNADNEELRRSGPRWNSRADEINFTHTLASKSAPLAAFTRHPALLRMATGLLGPDLRLWIDLAVTKYPTTSEFPWHQDSGYLAVEPAWITCWVALTDATEDNGCLRVLPGSHSAGVVPHVQSPVGMVGYTGPDSGIALPMAKGSVAAISSLLLHRTGPNTTSEPRKAYIVEYCKAESFILHTGQRLDDLPLVTRDGEPMTAP
jgi:phytanoyl-CoA hydroxylase